MLRQLSPISAQEAAQKEAIALTVAAEAEKQTAQDRSEAVRIAAEADAQKLRLQAQGEADAKVLLAEELKSVSTRSMPKVNVRSMKRPTY